MSEEKKVNILASCLGNAVGLVDMAGYADDSIVSKTILDKPVGTITFFAFDKGQKLSEHTAKYDAVVQVLDGRALFVIGDEQKEVSVGQLIIMPANVPHSVKAVEKFKMLLTMIRE